MNSDILKGKWNQIKGDAKKTFGKLTDDDMMVIDGDITKAAGLVQERYGITREEAVFEWQSSWSGEHMRRSARSKPLDQLNECCAVVPSAGCAR